MHIFVIQDLAGKITGVVYAAEDVQGVWAKSGPGATWEQWEIGGKCVAKGPSIDVAEMPDA